MVELMTCCPGSGEAKNCQVVAFSAAAGEDDLRGAASQQRGDRFARPLDRRPRLLSMVMNGRRVPEVLPEVGLHGLKDLGQDGGGGVIVEIDAAHGYMPFYAVCVRTEMRQETVTTSAEATGSGIGKLSSTAESSCR